MKIKLTVEEFDNIMNNLKDKYKMFAPISIPYANTYSDTDVVRYEEVRSLKEIEFDKKSQFTAKEIVMPVTETLFYYTEDKTTIPEIDERTVLVFMRSCDVHGLERIDRVYLDNGSAPDFYYKRRRDKVKIVLFGCPETFRNCFCVSFNTNTTDDYDLGIKVDKGYVYLDIKDDEFKDIFTGEEVDFNIDFVSSNDVTVTLPEKLDPLEIADADIWREYDSRCIACGRCNLSCPTCSCFTMQDIVYTDNPRAGERRRVGAACHIDNFGLMAGGHDVRTRNGDRMRYKTMHKMYDYNERFGKQMCIACGRCDDVCPQYISISTAMNKVTKFVEGREK